MDPLLCLSDSDDDELLKAAAAERTRTKNVAWREPQFTVPRPFSMTKREEEDRFYQELRRELLHSPSPRAPSGKSVSPVRGHEVPLSSRLPMYHAILLEQELRRERQKRHSKARLLAKVRPFSFDMSPRPSSQQKKMKNWKSLPELRDLESKDAEERPRCVFKAKPMPWEIYGVEAEIRRQEEEYLKSVFSTLSNNFFVSNICHRKLEKKF